MASEVYSSTTTPNPKSSWCLVPSEHLDKIRFLLKITEVLLSFVAFILEEVVSSCASCTALYFFEFVSCTAFLFTLLLLILLSTTLHTRVGITCWPKLDFLYTAGIALLFLISSIVFAAGNNGSTLERSAVVFGFLAMVVFVVDLFWFYKTRGFPWQRGGKPESSNGGPAVVNSPPETEKLNSVTE
ncbi:CKLF-like MARVEL transmembrane domain-containing protein 6 isoform X2 [Toxotes jaculatrix]|uniref:CKLF-like MARVEL transmembrane domain-containing protein 6 isoform X2 n=1 Tax=Toxotes jaculatrix TaxID=941984 RepID=UPI001B3B0144|nr:CKLF-like MARVEL transmembrane domain-containing protein 6 isoform X2 [Toxotes jaculatrix]